jgi:hypothetical protein
LCRLPLRRFHIATEGENLAGFYNALLVHASTSEEADIKLVKLVGYTPFCIAGKMLVIHRMKFESLSQPVK